MIKAIIFDLGGVLFTNGTKSFARHIAGKHNSDCEKVYGVLNYSDIGNAYREGKVKVKPEETLFIDDKQINLPPAEQLGMKTLLFTTPEQLREDLNEMKLL